MSVFFNCKIVGSSLEMEILILFNNHKNTKEGTIKTNSYNKIHIKEKSIKEIYIYWTFKPNSIDNISGEVGP